MRSSNDYDDGDSSSTTSVYNKDEPTSVATAAGVSAAGGTPEPTTSILSGETETTTMINKTEEEEAPVLEENDFKAMIKESRLRSAQLMRQAMLLAPDKKLKDAQEEKLVEFDNLLENVADDDDTKLLLITMLQFEKRQLREFMTSVRIYQKQVKSLALSFDKDDSGGIPEPTSILFGETKTMTAIINKTEEEAAVLLEERDFKAMIKDSRLRSAQLIMRQAMLFAQDKTLEDAQEKEKEKEKLVELENFLQDMADDDPDLQLIKMLEFEQRQLDIHECDISHSLIGEVLSGAAPLNPVVEALTYPIKMTIQGIKSMTNFSINNKRG